MTKEPIGDYNDIRKDKEWRSDNISGFAKAYSDYQRDKKTIRIHTG